MTDEKTVEGKKLDNIMDKIQDLYFADSVLDTVWLTLKKEIEAYKDEEVEKAVKIDENTSDGYHTFKELYRYRMLYNACLFNSWASGHLLDFAVKHGVHKSWKHNDGELCFGGGWFIVMANLPTGQISNHYEAKDWELFKIPEKEVADEWDGHTPEQVAKRLEEYLNS